MEDELKAIDEELDKEFPDIAKLQDNVNTESTDEEENVEKDKEEIEDNETDEEKNEEENKEVNKEENLDDESKDNNKKESKEQFAFQKLRKELDDLKKVIASKDEEIGLNAKTIEELAIISGYSDIEAFKNAIKQTKINKEAKEKGYTSEQYRDIMSIRNEVDSVKEQNQKLLAEKQFNSLNNSIDKVFKENNLSEEDRQELISRLESQGFESLEQLYLIPNIESLITGVMMDKILDNKINSVKQSEMEKDKKLDEISDKIHKNGNADSSVDIDKLLDSEIAEIKKKRGY